MNHDIELDSERESNPAEAHQAEVEPVLDLRKAMADRVASELTRAVEQRIDEYFERRIDRKEIETGVDHLFSLLKEGKPRSAVLEELNRLADEVSARSLDRRDV